MNEVCQFRVEVDTDKYGDYLDTVFYIETNLHFLRIKVPEGATVGFLQRQMNENFDKVKNVSTQTFKLAGCLRGMTEYIPTTFKGVYFSVAHGILHTALIDFKWRDHLLISIHDDQDENGIYVKTTKKLTIPEFQHLEEKYSYRPDSLVQYFLGKDQDFYLLKYNKRTLEDLFDVFLAPLILNWENHKRMFETLLIEEHETITSSQKPFSTLEPSNVDLEF